MDRRPANARQDARRQSAVRSAQHLRSRTIRRRNLTIEFQTWLPATTVRGIVAIAHGLSEHASRYERFARALGAAGFAVYAPDHRGHGRAARDAGTLGEFGPNGWNGILDDLASLIADARRTHPNVPVFFFGHSMGSVLAQRYVQLHGGELAGAVFCGTFGSIDGLEAILQMADAVALGDAASAPSVLQPQMFAGFNASFEPKTTGFEWLSRDESEVRKYADDPLCGFPLTNGSLAQMLHGFADAWRAEHEAAVPVELPLLVVAGANDPAGAATGNVAKLVERYRSHGMHDLTVTIYPDDRHEILNELDRDNVQADIVAWFAARA